MDTVFTLTPGQILTGFLAICAGLVTIGKAVELIGRAIMRARKPNTDQDRRLDEIERRMDEFERFFSVDKARLDSIANGGRIIQKALLALLDHGIDGNDIEGMKKIKAELTEYLLKD